MTSAESCEDRPADPAGSTDDELLDRVFEFAVQCIATGAPPDLDVLLDGREHLRDRARELLELARQVAVATDLDAAPSALTEIAGFSILAELGRGGMGIVYLARQESLGRIVALKVLAPALMVSPRSRERFAREARALGRLRHPNVVTVYEVIAHPSLCAYAMEWIDGTTLSHAIAARDPGLRADRVAQIGFALASALDVVHAAGLVHRDVKPGNVLLRKDGTPLLSDFSLVHDVEHGLHTATGEFVGTPAYAAPEQLRGEQSAVGPRTDVYSLGVTLYSALAGQTPFGSSSSAELLRRIEAGSATPLRQRSPQSPRDLATIVHKAMDRDPRRRYPSAAAFAADLQLFLEHRPILARPAGLALRLQRWLERSPQLALALAGILVALVLGLGASIKLGFDLAAQRDAAVSAEKEAKNKSEVLGAVVEFMRGVFRSGDASLLEGRADISVREAVDQASRNLLSGETRYRPEVEQAIRYTVGELLASIGFVGPAETHLGVALELGREVHGPESSQVAEVAQFLARVQRLRGRLPEAERSSREAVHVRRRLLASGAPYGVVNLAQSLNSLGIVLRNQKRYQEAEASYAESMDLYRSALGDAHECVAVVHGSLATLHMEMDRLDEAERDASTQLRIFLGIHHDRPHLDVGRSRFTLGSVLLKLGRRDEGLGLMRDGLTMVTAMVGRTHTTRADEALAFGRALQGNDELVEAEAVMREAHEAFGALGNQDGVARVAVELAGLLTKCARCAEIEPLLAPLATSLANSERGRLVSRTLAEARVACGLHAEAEVELLRVWGELEQIGEVDHAARRDVAGSFVTLYEAWQRAAPVAGHDAKAAAWRRIRDDETAATGQR